MEVKNEAYQYQWIINEGLLRDEGTLFGIAGSAIGEKIEAIRDYYRIKKAAERTKREQLEKEIAIVNSDVAKFLTERGKRRSSGNPGNDDSSGDSLNLLPIILQFFFYIGICFFNFFLETYWLAPVIHSTFICVGLYLFGLFSVFMGRSIMYNPARALNTEGATGEARENWKIYFEEFAVPLVVSLFISILPARAYPLPFSILSALVFFLLFLLSGKGLVNTFFKVRSEWGCWFQSTRRKKENKINSKKLHELQAELNLSVTALEELDGDEDYRINIFMSEYKLAFESRQLASTISVKKLA